MNLETLMLTSMTELEEKVARGAQRLDLYHPGWNLEIDVTMIEIGCEEHSITGQLFGPQIYDQFIGVGITPNRDNPAVTIDEFIGMGFGVARADDRQVPEALKAAMRSVAVEMAEAFGLDPTRIPDVPDVLPLPRDMDLVAHEAATLSYLWEREAAKRNG